MAEQWNGSTWKVLPAWFVATLPAGPVGAPGWQLDDPSGHGIQMVAVVEVGAAAIADANYEEAART